MISWRQLGGLGLALAFVSVLASTHDVRDGDTPAARGAAVYAKYCALCHGAGGVGDGRAATLQKVAPADLTVSTRPRSYMMQIVREGGVEMGRSDSMPAWREVLSDAEIADVVAYVQSLHVHNDAARAQSDSPASAGRKR